MGSRVVLACDDMVANVGSACTGRCKRKNAKGQREYASLRHPYALDLIGGLSRVLSPTPPSVKTLDSRADAL